MFYEILIQKIIREVSSVFITNTELSSFLIEKKYLWYAHRIDYTTKDNFYEHYFIWWDSYIKLKWKLLNENKFYLETDLKGFYDNISHDNLIYLIKKIIEWNNTKIDVKLFNNILLNLNNVLFKTSWFKKKWIPQWLISSDILSQLYTWLILYFETLKPEKLITFKNWIFKLENWNVKIINYSDDIVLFSNSERYLFKWFSHLNNILEKNWLELNYNKTTWIKKVGENNSFIEIDISKIKNNNIVEIKKLFDFLISLLSQPFNEIQIPILKKYFKFFYKISILEDFEKLKIVKKLLRTINFNKWNIENNKKISLLIIISPDNFINLLNEILVINKKIEEIFINKYLKDYTLYLSEIHLVFIYSYLWSDFIQIRSEIKKIVIWIDNSILKNFLLEKDKKYLKNNFYSNKFYWLYNLIYWDWNNLEENNIWIKLDNLFDIDTSFTDNLFRNKIFLSYVTWKNDLSLITLEKLNSILDNLLIIKNINKFFYLENSSFIADFHSLINILLTILYSLEKEEYEIVKISEIKWRLNNKNHNLVKILNRTFKIVNRYDDFLVYSTQSRAKLNHKEFDVKVTKNLKVESFTNYDILELNIKSFLNDVLKEINEIYKQKDI